MLLLIVPMNHLEMHVMAGNAGNSFIKNSIRVKLRKIVFAKYFDDPCLWIRQLR